MKTSPKQTKAIFLFILHLTSHYISFKHFIDIFMVIIKIIMKKVKYIGIIFCLIINLLGRLILALGGTPTVRTQLRIGAAPLSDCEDGHDRERWLEETLRHRRGSIELYQTLMGMTEDRIVRSVLVQLLDGEQYAVRRLADAMRKLKKDECCD